MNFKKYKQYETITLTDRTWPDNKITKAPIWCSTDLRDCNQALPIPMSVEQKLKYFDLLIKIGYKEIEIGFPSASETEYEFTRRLIEENRIPDDVTIQVLVQSREHLIRKTFESLKGIKKAIIHLYNSTSTKQREVVFGKSKEEIMDIAINGTQLVKELTSSYPETRYILEYSPESFPGTEMDYALEICNAVLKVWQPTVDNKAIINLPTTVEMATPNVFADQIEWFCRNLTNRESIIVSVHTHNDRGTSIASTELAIMAGADRVEGTLFGNGERTGNADIFALAMNLYSQGIDPNITLDSFNSIDDIIRIYKECTRMEIPDRHPYVGDLVFTAFSGSHQDAISKGLKAYEKQDSDIWEVPYLPIDPKDLGRSYEPIIRINSQSGKGGIAYILETNHGYRLPKKMHPEFASIVQKQTDINGTELSPNEIYEIFNKEYLTENNSYNLGNYKIEVLDANEVHLDVNATINGTKITIKSSGDGPISAFINGLNAYSDNKYSIINYSEHALDSGVNARTIAYVQVSDSNNNKCYGVGVDDNINSASIKAVLSSISKLN